MTIQDNQYINIQGWMRTKLKLKGNELMTYAIIYGFSQDGQSKFSGTRDYIKEWTGMSVRTASTVLESLVDQGLIVKNESFVGKDGGTRNQYSVNFAKISEGVVPQQEDEGKKKGRKKPQNIPTIEEVAAYIAEKQYGIDAQRFYAYYEERGWKRGGKPVGNWKLCASTWEQKRLQDAGRKASGAQASGMSKAQGFAALGAQMEAEDEQAGNW